MWLCRCNLLPLPFSLIVGLTSILMGFQLERFSA
jgi:hypothetical protein